jgi:hypothetical protein
LTLKYRKRYGEDRRYRVLKALLVAQKISRKDSPRLRRAEENKKSAGNSTAQVKHLVFLELQS